MKDTYRHKGLRKRLVDTLRNKGISDERVLKAINILPRHFFLDTAFEEHAYEDKAFPIGNKQTISHPYTVAYQTSMLQVKKGEKVLEIGTGSGYQASILALLGAKVFTIERQEDLFLQTQSLLDKMDVGEIQMYYKDGFEGIPSKAPFDKIIITAGANRIPDKLFEQLAIGGRMVIPYSEKEDKVMFCLTKNEQGKAEVLEEGEIFRFVPFLEGVNKSTNRKF